MSNAGKKVKAHYRGTLDDGTQFDSSYDRGTPIEFTCMAGQMIPGFDAAVEGMALGEKKTVRIEPKDAYGEYDPNRVQRIPRSQVPNADQMPLGGTVYLSNGFQQFPAQVEETELVVDMNHELAGKALTFEIELVEIA